MPEREIANLPEELQRRRRVIVPELQQRTFWFVRLRWWVPPAIFALSLLAWAVGLQLAWQPIGVVAAFILVCNIAFWAYRSRLADPAPVAAGPIQRFAYVQILLDYAAMFVLIHYTGGVASPLWLFALFHVIFAGILLPPRSAYGIAALVVVAMSAVGAGEALGWLDHHPLIWHGQALDIVRQPLSQLLWLGGYASVVFLIAASTTVIIRMLRQRIVALAEVSEKVLGLNEKLQALHTMTQAILATHRLEEVLHRVTAELAKVMGIEATSIKLLSEDGRFLRYVARFGLPDALEQQPAVEVAKSPLNRRILDGETFVLGNVRAGDSFQFSAQLAAAGLQSVMFVPLKVQDRVIGILGAYCSEIGCFAPAQVFFFRLAAELVAIAIDNARAYEKVEQLGEEHARFTRRVAHDMRAPLASIVTMLDVLTGGYKGPFSEGQTDYLQRIDRRARAMLEMVNELMTLARTRNRQSLESQAVDVHRLAEKVRRTFEDSARNKDQHFEVAVAADTPALQGDERALEEVFENLVSNAIKYSPRGGRIALTFAAGPADTVQAVVKDNGIGIPQKDQAQLFTEFFRASNARKMEETGTGLGLAIVREVVEGHGGRIEFQSEPGQGTRFEVRLPAVRAQP